MRILVTGSRDWSDDCTVYEALKFILGDNTPENFTVVHGAARGADMLAKRAAERLGMVTEPHPANWNRYGNAAGPIRNHKMVSLGADICIAFPERGSVGTVDCMTKARAAGIPVYNLGDEIEGFPVEDIRSLLPST